MTEDDLAKLTKCLGMLSSSHDGEALAARNMCDRILRRYKLTWADVPNLNASKNRATREDRSGGGQEEAREAAQKQERERATREEARERARQQEREKQERAEQLYKEQWYEEFDRPVRARQAYKEKRAREEALAEERWSARRVARQMASARRGGAYFYVILAVVIGLWALRDYNKPVAPPSWPSPLATPAVMSTPTQSAAGPATPQAASGGTEKASYESLLIGLINRQLHVPPEARARHLIHVGQIGLFVDELGQLTHQALYRASGDPVLDSAYVEAVRRAAPFPAPPRGLPHGFILQYTNQDYADLVPPSANPASPGSPAASAAKMSPSLWDQFDGLLEEQYKRCWNFAGLGGQQKYVPEIHVQYSPDGSLIGQPVLLNPPSDQNLRNLAESAIRAVRRCDPLRIPAQYQPYYDQWKGRIVRFDPEEML